MLPAVPQTPLEAPVPPADDNSGPQTVAGIFARAERVFERRVDQLLQLKRHKARVAGTAFNARKAKRDARTVAGREKLDALVRRLADLAALQEAALGPERSATVISALKVSATALVGAAALAAANAPPVVSPTPDQTDLGTAHELSAPAVAEFEPTGIAAVPMRATVVTPAVGQDNGRDVLDTSSCSDDCCSVAGCLTNFKDFRDTLSDVVADPVSPDHPIRTPPPAMQCDSHIFPATESVVNFVLECDEDACATANIAPAIAVATEAQDTSPMPSSYPGALGGFVAMQNAYAATDASVGQEPYVRYDEISTNGSVAFDQYDWHSGLPNCQSDWTSQRYSMQSASSL